MAPSALAQTYTISTVAGTAQAAGYVGNNGLATAVSLHFPQAVAVDSTGNLFIADSDNNVVRELQPSGIITTIAGTGSSSGFGGDGGPATSAQSPLPYGVAVDGAGNLYISDYGAAVVRQVSPAGIITTVAGVGGHPGYSGDNGQAISAHLELPRGLAVDAAGDLFIADSGNQVVRMVSPTGIITTVAGIGGRAGYSGDNGVATSAQLNTPTGVAVDSAGDLFIADSANTVIRKVSPAGLITTIAGIKGQCCYGGDNGPATAAILFTPTGVAVDAGGNLFIADLNDDCVREISAATGIITTVAGTGTGFSGVGGSGDGGPATSASLFGPSGVAVDGAGNIFIADTLNDRVRKVSPDGIITTVAGLGTPAQLAGPATAAVLSNPSSVAVGTTGDLLIADTGWDVVRKVSAFGDITTIAGGGTFVCCSSPGGPLAIQFGSPSGVAVDNAGNVIIADSGYSMIDTVSAAGSISILAGFPSFSPNDGGYTGAIGPATGAELYGPRGVAVDGAGNVFIADTRDNLVRKVSPDGTIMTLAGTDFTENGTVSNGGYSGDNGGATSAKLDAPSGVAVDAGGNVYIADSSNHVIRKVSTSGIITTIAGIGTQSGFSGDNGPATSAKLKNPLGVAVDGAGNIFVADTGNQVIREISASGVITTIAGIGGQSGYAGDGGPAVSAKFNSPAGVAVDGLGNVFVADSGNNVVRKLSSTSAQAVIQVQKGWWWNPTSAGTGYSLELSPIDGSIYFAGFLYDSSGAPVWYSAFLETLGGNVYSGALTQYQGGQTLAGTYHAITGSSTVGTVSLAFSSPANASLSITGTGLNPTNIMIERYAFVTDGLNAPPDAAQPQTGWWWNPAEGGRGYFMEVQANVMFMAAFMYDTNGKPIWYVSLNPLTSNTAYSGMLSEYGNGQALGGSYVAPTETNSDVGTISVQFATPTMGALTLPDGVQTPIQRYTF